MKSKLSAIALILIPVTASAQGASPAEGTGGYKDLATLTAGRDAGAKAHAISAKCLVEQQTVAEYAACWDEHSANPTGGAVGASDGGSE